MGPSIDPCVDGLGGALRVVREIEALDIGPIKALVQLDEVPMIADAGSPAGMFLFTEHSGTVRLENVAQVCTVCRHIDRAQIDRALLASEPLRNIAKRVSLSATALFRHKAHIEKRLVEDRERAEAAQDRDLSAELTKLAARANRLAEKAESDGDLRTALQGIRELSRLLELEARLAGQIGGAKVNVNIGALDVAALTRDQRSELKERLFEIDPRIPLSVVRRMIGEERFAAALRLDEERQRSPKLAALPAPAKELEQPPPAPAAPPAEQQVRIHVNDIPPEWRR